MFEHLDDPNPPALGELFQRQVMEQGRARRRRLAGAGVASLAAVAVVGAAGLYGRAAARLDEVERVEIVTADDAADPESAAATPLVRTVLLVGTDWRAELGGAPDSGRSDTIVAVRIDGAEGRIAGLSIPRDLQVSDPVSGEPVRISSVVVEHGLGGLTDVVQTDVGIQVDHVAAVDFDGFVSLVDLLGGIDVALPYPGRDPGSGLGVEAGCARLDGTQALQLARARKIEWLIDGHWESDPTGDLGRAERQQVLLLAALTELSRSRPDPITANQAADWAVAHVALDADLDRTTVAQLAELAASIDPAAITFGVVPVNDAVTDGGAQVLIRAEDFDQIVADFAAGGELLDADGVGLPGPEVRIGTCEAS